MRLYRILFYFFILISLSLPLTEVRANATPRCLKNLVLTFYDDSYLDQALNMHRVYQSTWSPIKSELRSRARKVPELMYTEGKKQRPNPLDYPMNSQEAERILIDVLYMQFQETLNNFNIMNRDNIRDMFNYVRARQQSKIDACLKSSR
ncbi:MAG: hypothetical protein AAGG81_06515 [Chlamydiota bacterium]